MNCISHHGGIRKAEAVYDFTKCNEVKLSPSSGWKFLTSVSEFRNLTPNPPYPYQHIIRKPFQRYTLIHHQQHQVRTLDLQNHALSTILPPDLKLIRTQLNHQQEVFSYSYAGAHTEIIKKYDQHYIPCLSNPVWFFVPEQHHSYEFSVYPEQQSEEVLFEIVFATKS